MLLVFRRAVAFDVTQELIGGAVVTVWERLKDSIRETREAQQYPMWMEWFQWLAEQFARQDRLQQSPAHVQHRDDWSPGHYSPHTSSRTVVREAGLTRRLNCA